MSESKQPFAEKVRLIRWRMTKEETSFAREIRLIPRGFFVVMIALFAIAEIVAQIVYTYTRGPFPRLGLAGVVVGASVGATALLAVFVYINRDAKRRGMNSTLWTLIAIFVPYLIGLFAYFLVREPLPFNCPQCGASVSARFNYCPSCKYNLRPSCPGCKREIRPSDRYCPHCAQELAGAPGS